METSGERRGAVDRAREAWVRSLIDLSRRNNLLYYRPLRTGTLELTASPPGAMAELLAGKKVLLSSLVPPDQEVVATARVQEIRRRALANLEEKGLQTLFLAVGMARWSPADRGREANAPVLLVPVDIESRGRESRRVSMERAGEAQVSPVLLHVLEFELGVPVDHEALLEGRTSVGEDEPIDPTPVLARLREAGASIPGFGVADGAVLGNFSFQKMAMVRDLREAGDVLEESDLIAALAGDPGARAAVLGGRGEVDPHGLDAIPADREFLILDADSSQQRVVQAALGSQDGVVQGPPGTGKSQTIANLIATVGALGGRVLFVAEKRAALEAVVKRLEQTGLQHLALDLHGADVSRRDVMRGIAESLDRVRDATPIDTSIMHREFEDRRGRLNEHDRLMHTPISPCGLEVYALQGDVMTAPEPVRSPVRWRGPDLDRLTDDAAFQVSNLLVEAAGFDRLFLRDDPSPWTNAEIADGAAAARAMELATKLAAAAPATVEGAARVAAAAGLRPPGTVADMAATAGLLTEVNRTAATHGDGMFAADPAALAAALAPAKKGSGSAFFAWLLHGRYRRARSTLRGMRMAKASTADMAKEMEAVTGLVVRWRAVALPGPTASVHRVDGAEGVAGDVSRFASELGELAGRWPRWTHDAVPLPQLSTILQRLATDGVTPPRLPALREIERKLVEYGAGAFVTWLREAKPAPDLWPKQFRFAWLASCLDRARETQPALGGFNGVTQSRFVEDFRQLDSERLRVAAARVERAHAERVIAVMNAHPDQEQLVRAEARKKARHLPLRKTFASAGDVMTALRPCWMASPLSVSQLLPAANGLFDMVIFDEASQVLPEDAVPSLMRGRRALVAGDDRQLPPTTFFDVAGEAEEEATDQEEPLPVAGFQSILDLMAGFLPPWTLDWHYRSKSESLIAFSNHYLYGDRLVTFPDPGLAPAVSHILVHQLPGVDGQEESSSAEVSKVVEMVLAHATAMMTRQEAERETLGVIAMGIKHSRRIEAALDLALESRPDLDPFFDQHLQERFFVKNLERVQGDERDAIILSVGYGKDRTGRLLYRFGPLNVEGGERRLNVAITRARRRMTVVSSFAHTDMDPNRTASKGAQLLRAYLEYAASGGAVLPGKGKAGTPEDEFEQAVYDALTARGLHLLPQWGASVYRIDLAAQHPTRPGRLVLAIECDGATYHSAPTARDRDRLRQQQLEALGWRFHRIWSTDWFTRPDEEVARAVTAFNEAVAYADRIDAGNASLTAPAAAPDPAPAPPAAPLPPAPDPMRGSRPRIGRRDSIGDYTQNELLALIAWIGSDDRLRTDDEIVEEMIDQLGFARRGPRIVEAIRAAIAEYRRRGNRV